MRARGRAAHIALGIALCALVGVTGAVAQDAIDPLIAAGTSDPLELERVARRIGDEAVIERLAEGRATSVRLAAIGACGGMHAPESALQALALIAADVTPDLAPAAAIALLAITRRLDPQELDSREVLRGDLEAARAAIAAVAADETARADVRRAALVAIDALAQLGVAGG